MKTFASIVLLGLLMLEVVLAAPTRNEEKARKLKQIQLLPNDLLEEHGYVNQDPRNFFEYEDGLIIDEPLIESGSPTPPRSSQLVTYDSDYEEEEYVPHEPLDPGAPSVPGLLGPESKEGLPTCLLCTCLSGSVYCDDTDIKNIPALPKDTTHFYGRFNKLTNIKKGDFSGLNHLKRIDVTGNRISSIDEDALRQLPELVDLMVASNELVQLPELPKTMVSIDASYNKLNSSGIKNEAFKDMNNLEYLYLAGNSLNYVPLPLPESLRSINLQNNNVRQINDDTFCNSKDIHYVRKALELIRLDGNPINLSKTPSAYICLPHVPYGNY
ncbi:epiphycan-like [Hemiscyllium ocellatum]|uniref:epiphycan-like n=1 Tax=Hemiscyllium ocellatum TaxID=170820 RepID=UPI002966EAED|nr:epiphycan-like [Hemiscyllium ocellatum]XP_060695237.1 epiphycan-like [Hemiscyllium ocellatum]